MKQSKLLQSDKSDLFQNNYLFSSFHESTNTKKKTNPSVWYHFQKLPRKCRTNPLVQLLTHDKRPLWQPKVKDIPKQSPSSHFFFTSFSSTITPIYAPVIGYTANTFTRSPSSLQHDRAPGTRIFRLGSTATMSAVWRVCFYEENERAKSMRGRMFVRERKGRKQLHQGSFVGDFF